MWQQHPGQVGASSRPKHSAQSFESRQSAFDESTKPALSCPVHTRISFNQETDLCVLI